MEYSTRWKLFHVDIWFSDESPFFQVRGIWEPGFHLHLAEGIAKEIVLELDLTVVDQVSHDFPGGGETFVYVLSESHLALHTYPEHRYISVDLYTCGSCDPSLLRDVLLEKMESWGISFMQHGEVVIRGVPVAE